MLWGRCLSVSLGIALYEVMREYQSSGDERECFLNFVVDLICYMFLLCFQCKVIGDGR